MKADELLQAIGEVDDQLIERAAKKDYSHLMRWGALAAMLILVIGISFFSFRDVTPSGSDIKMEASTSMPATEEPVEDDPSEAADPEFDASDWKVAMVTDYGDITYQSFDQNTYEGCADFSENYGVELCYYRPSENSTAGRVESIETAIAEGYNVIVLPGYAFGGAIVEVAPEHPDVKFIALDVAVGDLLETAVANAGEMYDYNPDNWDLAEYVDLRNVYCANYREELSGYMAGYAAVKLGYTELGFLGSMAVPAVTRYGYGFIQGADAAAAETGADVEVNYLYSGQFFGDADVTHTMDEWYADGTQAVFACGGSIFTSVAEAAAKVGGKVIGVDIDQSAIIDGIYGEGMTITSATKGLGATAYDTLVDIIVNGNWANYAGKIETLGIVNADNPEDNYLQLPWDTTQWNESFTQEDYVALITAIANGEIIVSGDISVEPTVSIKVNYLDING